MHEIVKAKSESSRAFVFSGWTVADREAAAVRYISMNPLDSLVWKRIQAHVIDA